MENIARKAHMKLHRKWLNTPLQSATGAASSRTDSELWLRGKGREGKQEYKEFAVWHKDHLSKGTFPQLRVSYGTNRETTVEKGKC